MLTICNRQIIQGATLIESLNEIQSNPHIISTFEMNLVFLVCDFFFFFFLIMYFWILFARFYSEGISGAVESAGHGEARAAHFLCGTVLQAALFGSISIHL